MLSEHADRLLKSLEQATTIRGQVESLVIPLLHTGDLAMDDIARRMGMSRPSLYRRLREEGVSFEALIDDLRHRMALHYLSGRKTSVNETAYLVGFLGPELLFESLQALDRIESPGA